MASMDTALTGLSKPASDMKKHPGFAAVKSKIASKEGISGKAAGAILASASRSASAASKKVNPEMKKVK